MKSVTTGRYFPDILRLLSARHRIIYIDLNRLYDYTLFHTEALRPWACDEKGKYVGLEIRAEFVRLYLNSGGSFSKKDIKDTQYFKLLKKGFDKKPRDGGRDWIYQDAYGQAQRFIQLIISLYDYGYITYKRSPLLDDFCSSSSCHVEKKINSEVVVVDYKRRPYEGLMTVLAHKEYYSIWNGNHRLAILKVFHEISLFKEDKIPVLLCGKC